MLSVMIKMGKRGRSLNDIKKSDNLNMLVVAVLRNGKLTIPDGNFIVAEGKAEIKEFLAGPDFHLLNIAFKDN